MGGEGYGGGGKDMGGGHIPLKEKPLLFLWIGVNWIF